MSATRVPLNPVPRLLRRREVERMTSLSRSSIYARMSLGKFPRPIHLGEQTVAWLEAEVLAWIDEQIVASRGEGRAA